MADRIVGQVGIKAVPDVRQFNKLLTRDLRALQQKTVLIPVDLEDKSFKAMQEKIERQADRLKIKIKPELDDSDLKRQLSRLDDEATVEIEVDTDEAELKRNERVIKDSFDRIEMMRRELTRQMEREAERGVVFDQEHLNKTADKFKDLVARLQDEAEVKFGLELDPENIELVEAQMDNLIRKYEDRNIPLEAVVENFWASRNLNWITRPRTVEIFTKLNAASASATAAAIAALSGARLSGEFGSDMWDFFKDLDKNLPMLSVASTSLIALGGTLFGVTSGLVSFGAGIMHITPLLLTLPGLVMGTVAAVVAMGVAWRDVKDELGSLEAPFTNLGNMMSAAYWDQARDPILSFVNDLMPQMERALTSASGALGGFTGALADSFSKEFANGRFESIFETFSEGFDVLAQGTDGFAGAIVNMAQIAGLYWPRLAGWLNTTIGRFDQWLTDISTDGRLSDWMERGIDSLYDLWGGLEAGGRILRGLWTAANNAGADAMAGFRAQMEAWDELVNRPSSQRALADWFEGGREAAKGMGDAVELIFAPFARNSHLVKDTFAASGDAIREFGRALGDIFGSSSSITGFTAGLQSIEQAFVNIGGSSQALGNFLGATAEATGEFARILSGPLGTALDVVLPRAERVLLAALEASDALAASFEKVLSSAQFADLADDLVVLAGALADMAVAAAPALGDLLQMVVNLLSKIGPVGVTALAGLGGVASIAVTGASAFSRFVGVLDTVAPAEGRMRGALGKAASFLGGPWGIAAGAAVVGFGAIIAAAEDSKAEFEKFDEAVRRGAEGVELFQIARTGVFEGGTFKMDEIQSFLDAMDKIDANALSSIFDSSTWGLQFSSFAADLREVDGALSGMDFANAASGFRAIAEQAGLTAEGTERLLREMPGLEAAFIAYARANDVSIEAADGTIDSSRLVALAMGEIGPAADAARQGIEEVGGVMLTASERAQALYDSQRMLVDASWATENAMIRYGEAVTSAQEALAEGFEPALLAARSGFDLSTASGAQANQMMEAMVTSAQDSALSMLENGNAANYVAMKQDEARAQIFEAAKQMGLSDEAARRYADRLLAIPDEIATDIIANVAAAQGTINRFIKDNNGRRIGISIDVIGPSTMPSTLIGRGQYGHYADGGLIPGTPSLTDNTFAHVATGEYIVKTAQTQKYLPLLEAINNDTLSAASMPRWDTASARAGVKSAAISGLSLATGGGDAPLVGELTMVSSGDTRDDIDEVMFRLRSMRRGGR